MSKTKPYLPIHSLLRACSPGRALFSTFAAIALLSACADENGLRKSDDESGDDDGDFVSDNPMNPGGRDKGGDQNGDEGAASTGGEDGGGEAPEDDGNDEDGGEQAVLEADIIQIEGDKLYALSEYSGLTVVDVSNPDKLKSLGRYVAEASPFEMYVEDGQVFAMFSDFSFWEWDEELESWSPNSSSRLIALDASNPDDIQVRGEFKIPGRIQDSRRIGDLLYLVTFEDGYCWRCDKGQNTTITSFNVADPADPKQVDQIVISGDDEDWDWKRSVSATNKRLYVGGGNRWSDETADHEIDVIDISAGDGTMKNSATVPIAGVIESRWQMNEYEDVLRVISQPSRWWDEDENESTEPVPVVETFSIKSAEEFEPLGRLEMVLPRPEDLRSVRFDGEKAYAITFERTDPLFTLDLKEPENPRQVGELEIPGWVYHMEPRGDRILALGFDRDNDEGSVNVSLFDVSVFDEPRMIKRVNFGGDWANFAEDQDRIHKAFTILEDEELIMVPHQGWVYNDVEGEEAEWCRGEYKSGIQLVDWADDNLKLRGVAQTHGAARRALLHKERLLAVSDDAVHSFNINDRDNPEFGSHTALATNADRLIPLGDHMVRITRDWWVDDTKIEIVDADHPDDPEAIGSLDIGDALSSGNCENEYIYFHDVFTYNKHLYLLYEAYEWDYEEYEKGHTQIAVVDASNPAEPKYVDTFNFEFTRGWARNHFGRFSLDTDSIIQVADKLVFMTMDHVRDDSEPEGYDWDRYLSTYEVISLADPDKPEPIASFKRKDALAYGGMTKSGDYISSWRMSSANDDASKVRFYLERLDLSDDSVRVLKDVNVPGAVLSGDDKRAWTVDFKLREKEVKDNDDCWDEPKRVEYDEENKRCYLMDMTLHRVAIKNDKASIIDDFDVESEGALDDIQASEDRVFARSFWGYYGDDAAVDNDDGEGEGEEYRYTSTLYVFGDVGGDIKSYEKEIKQDWWRFDQVEGSRAVLRGGWENLTVVDARDMDEVSLDNYALTRGYWCSDVVFDDEDLYCALGQFGVVQMSLLE